MKAISLILILLFASACAQRISKTPDQDILLSKNRQFRQCYEESDSYSGRSQMQKGTVLLGFTIKEDGSVANEKVIRSDFKDPNMHACIIGLLRRIKFPTRTVASEFTKKIGFSGRL